MVTSLFSKFSWVQLGTLVPSIISINRILKFKMVSNAFQVMNSLLLFVTIFDVGMQLIELSICCQCTICCHHWHNVVRRFFQTHDMEAFTKHWQHQSPSSQSVWPFFSRNMVQQVVPLLDEDASKESPFCSAKPFTTQMPPSIMSTFNVPKRGLESQSMEQAPTVLPSSENSLGCAGVVHLCLWQDLPQIWSHFHHPQLCGTHFWMAQFLWNNHEP